MIPDPRPATEFDDAVDLSADPTVTHALPGTPTVMPLAARPGRIGPYRLVRELGSGGMGIVFEAEDEFLRRRVALKVLRTDLPAEQVARDRFVREAQAMAAIGHDHVVPIYQVGEDAGRPFMAMPLLDGETLEAKMAREGRLPSAEAARIAREIALGLGAAHTRGLIHRDVKPANVWLEAPTGRVKLLDFGLALAQNSSHLTHSGFVIGTPAFMSPEQARGEPLDGRSDLFSLGVILYLMTTGERPFDGPTPLAVMRNLELHHPARVNVKRTDVPAAFSNLIMELLAKQLKDRPANAELVADRLARPEIFRQSRLPVAPMGGSSVDVLPIAVSPSRNSYPAYSQPRPTSTAPTGMRVLFLIALAAIGIGSFWYFQIANFGKLTIEAAPEVEVRILQAGALQHTSTTERQFDLRPGVYELVLVKPQTGFKLARTVVEIRRDATEVVKVERDFGR